MITKVRAHAHDHRRPMLDSRFLGCMFVGCPSVFAIPLRPAPAITHSPTSVAAAQMQTEKKIGDGELRVLTALRKAGPARLTVPPFECDPPVIGGLCDFEGEAMNLFSVPSTWRARRIGLTQKNLVIDSGLTRPTPSGSKATVWEVREP